MGQEVGAQAVRALIRKIEARLTGAQAVRALIRKIEARLTGAQVSAEREVRPKVVGVEGAQVSLSVTTRVRCTPYFEIDVTFLHVITLEQAVPESELRRAQTMRALVEACLPYHAGLVSLLTQQMGVPPVIMVPAGAEQG